MKFVTDRVEFAAQRRAVLARGDEDVTPAVREALAQWGGDGWWAPIITAAEALFDLTAEAEGVRDPAAVAGAREEFTEGLGEPLALTTEPGLDVNAQVARIAAWISTSAVNAATMAAAGADEDEVNLEWVTMHDPSVRAMHDDVDGQSVPAGSPFTVAGYELHYPGEPVGPPAVWINCRCVVRPGPGGNMTAAAKQVDEIDDLDPDAPEITDDALDLDVPFYGVALPEGLPTGDRRKFAVGSVRYRELPLPYRAQPADIGGHDGAVTIGRIDRIWRDEETNLIKYEGIFDRSPAAEEYIVQNANRMRRGVSVDVDDATAEVQNEDGSLFDPEAWKQGDPEPFTVVTDGRIAAITGVDIPAFQEAFIAIGTWADHPIDEPTDPVDAEVAPVAAACETCEVAALLSQMPSAHLAEFEAKFGQATDDLTSMEFEASDGTKYRMDEVGLHVFAPGTKDGPGWITHPKATSRIRHYWVHGKGAAKIRWGVPGDFNRCRKQLAKYVKNPDWLAGLCANMHKEAIKLWPGQEGGKKAEHAVEGIAASAFTLVAGGYSEEYPREWFSNPGFTGPTRITVTEEGRIFGHVASWGVCHIGISGVCTTPPNSLNNYADFMQHTVGTTQGTIPCGVLTMGTGHAGQRLRAAAATAHYDDTGTLVAKVAAGEDQYGIWVSGVVAPGLSERELFALQGATLSGDWREKRRGNLELVAALVVNVPGFPIPHTSIAASGTEQITLVASGIMAPSEVVHDVEPDEVQKALARRERVYAARRAVNEARRAVLSEVLSR